MKLKKLLVLGLVSLLTLTSVSNADAYYSKKDKKETSVSFKGRENLIPLSQLSGTYWGDTVVSNSDLIKNLELGKTYKLSAILTMSSRYEPNNSWDRKKGFGIYSIKLQKWQSSKNVISQPIGNTEYLAASFDQLKNGEKQYISGTFVADEELLNPNNEYLLLAYSELCEPWVPYQPFSLSSVTFSNIQLYEVK